jgi:hypothetical protein
MLQDVTKPKADDHQDRRLFFMSISDDLYAKSVISWEQVILRLYTLLQRGISLLSLPGF